jgi:hypothetical protein
MFSVKVFPDSNHVCFNAEYPPRRHSVSGVGGKVYQDLIYLARISENYRIFFSKPRCYLNIFANEPDNIFLIFFYTNSVLAFPIAVAINLTLLRFPPLSCRLFIVWQGAVPSFRLICLRCRFRFYLSQLLFNLEYQEYVLFLWFGFLYLIFIFYCR